MARALLAEHRPHEGGRVSESGRPVELDARGESGGPRGRIEANLARLIFLLRLSRRVGLSCSSLIVEAAVKFVRPKSLG